jgi:hypothetical protein
MLPDLPIRTHSSPRCGAPCDWQGRNPLRWVVPSTSNVRPLCELAGAAQAEQARVVAEVAEQLQAIAIRSARGYWLAVAALCLSAVSLAVAVFRG